MKAKKPRPFVVSATLLDHDGHFDRDDSLLSLFFDDGRGVVPNEIWIGDGGYLLHSQKPLGGSDIGVNAEYRQPKPVEKEQ